MEYRAANKIFHKIKSYIKENYKCRVKKVGSLRRKCPIVNDIDFLIVSKNKTILQEIALKHSKVLESGNFRKKIYLKKYKIKIDLFYTEPTALAFALLHRTGNKNFNIRIRSHAKKRGLKLNQYGLFKGDKKYTFKTEREILDYLNITYKSPSERSK